MCWHLLTCSKTEREREKEKNLRVLSGSNVHSQRRQLIRLQTCDIAIQALHALKDKASRFQHSIQSTIQSIEAIHRSRTVHHEANATLGPAVCCCTHIQALRLSYKKDSTMSDTIQWKRLRHPSDPLLLLSSSNLLLVSVFPRFLKTKRSPATPSTKRISSNSPSDRFLSQILSNFLSLAWCRMDWSCATCGSTLLRTSLYIFHILLSSRTRFRAFSDAKANGRVARPSSRCLPSVVPRPWSEIITTEESNSLVLVHQGYEPMNPQKHSRQFISYSNFARQLIACSAIARACALASSLTSAFDSSLTECTCSPICATLKSVPLSHCSYNRNKSSYGSPSFKTDKHEKGRFQHLISQNFSKKSGASIKTSYRISIPKSIGTSTTSQASSIRATASAGPSVTSHVRSTCGIHLISSCNQNRCISQGIGLRTSPCFGSFKPVFGVLGPPGV